MKLPINDDDKLLYLLECKVNDATPDEGLDEYPDVKESLAKIAFGREAMADIPFHQYPDINESLSKLLEEDEEESDESPNVYMMCAEYNYADDVWMIAHNLDTNWSSFNDFMGASESDLLIGFDPVNLVYAELEHSTEAGTGSSSGVTYDIFVGKSKPYEKYVSNTMKTVVSEIKFSRPVGSTGNNNAWADVKILDAEDNSIIYY